MRLNTIHNEDCLEGMKRMPDKSVDLVFTSPPYNMNLRIRNGKYCSRQIVKEISTKYENFDDNLPMEEYYAFNKKAISELLRVSDLVFYNVQFLTGNKRALFKLIGEFNEKLKVLREQKEYTQEHCTVLGPAPCPVAKINYNYRYRLTLRCKMSRPLRLLLAHLLRQFSQDRENRGVSAFIDINGYD